MDKIKIRNLEIFAHHGVFPEENVLGQKFIINATLYTDLRNAGKTDELTASIHYGEICLQMEHFLTTHTFKLLERAAESLAETLLMNVPHLEKIKLEIKKPWAPIGLPLETVSVEIERSWHTAYIALGSNIGNKEQFLGQAVESLKNVPLCNVSAVSSFLTTKPYGVTDQDDFCPALQSGKKFACQPHIHHGKLVHDHKIRIQAVFFPAAVCLVLFTDQAEPAVKGACFVKTGAFRHPAACTARRRHKDNLSVGIQSAVNFQDDFEHGRLSCAR